MLQPADSKRLCSIIGQGVRRGHKAMLDQYAQSSRTVWKISARATLAHVRSQRDHSAVAAGGTVATKIMQWLTGGALHATAVAQTALLSKYHRGPRTLSMTGWLPHLSTLAHSGPSPPSASERMRVEPGTKRFKSAPCHYLCCRESKPSSYLENRSTASSILKSQTQDAAVSSNALEHYCINRPSTCNPGCPAKLLTDTKPPVATSARHLTQSDCNRSRSARDLTVDSSCSCCFTKPSAAIKWSSPLGAKMPPTSGA